ncbi:MAG: hypothetical protein ACR2PX_11735 [Endozoicomonas sp.]|uniref:hypothetical protein n=1 Tax=Endozoicomonas sp. TaxID=1892382 RepID=UPI003D9B216D
MKTLIFFSMLCIVSVVEAGFDESRAHIEQLLQQGKKVAILVIDMQVAYEGRGSLHKLSSVLGEQVKLLNYFASNDRVIYMDILLMVVRLWLAP